MQVEEREQDGVRILRLEGSLIHSNTEQLRRRLAALAEIESPGIALDFEAVDALDSAALGTCAAAAKGVSRGGTRPFVVFGANRMVERMWQLVGLERSIPLLPNQDAALARIRKASDD